MGTESKASAARMLYTEADDFPLTEQFRRRAADFGIELKVVAGFDEHTLINRGNDCDGLFLLHAAVNEEVLDRLPRLRVLARIGTGYEKIDVEAAKRRGIIATYVPDFCSEELSDTVLLFILAFSRHLPMQFRAAEQHRWLSPAQLPELRRLRGRRLGLLGFGASARRTAEKAIGFGLEVNVWTRTPRPAEYDRIGVTPVSFQEVLGCDFVSVHLPLTVHTDKLIGSAALQHFHSDGVLINIARGGIVDTDALVRALREERIAGAALDVVEPEPLPASHPLWQFPNVLVTPHCAALSREAIAQSFGVALDDAAAVLQGRKPKNPVPEHRELVERLSRV